MRGKRAQREARKYLPSLLDWANSHRGLAGERTWLHLCFASQLLHAGSDGDAALTGQGCEGEEEPAAELAVARAKPARAR